MNYYTPCLPIKPKTSELDIFYYEVFMLNKILSITPHDQIERNAVIECFLIHARNLIDFLENKRMHGDDLTCIDFIDEKKKKIDAIEIKLANDYKEKINKHLSHMTKQRVGEKIMWDMEYLRNQLNNEIKQFLKKLPNSYFPTIEGKSRKEFEDIIK